MITMARSCIIQGLVIKIKFQVSPKIWVSLGNSLVACCIWKIERNWHIFQILHKLILESRISERNCLLILFVGIFEVGQASLCLICFIPFNNFVKECWNLKSNIKIGKWNIHFFFLNGKWLTLWFNLAFFKTYV